MALPLAYFLTWTCYGQRLHGDARGSVDDLHKARGTPYLKPDPKRKEQSRDRMQDKPVELEASMRSMAGSAIIELCAEKEWRLLACAVRSTHIHVVVNCRGSLSPERAIAPLKARITRDLRRAGLVGPEARIWTHHGSTRWINFHEGLVDAIAYVEEWQSGWKRELLEERKRTLREQLAGLREWLVSNGLPADGVGVVLE